MTPARWLLWGVSVALCTTVAALARRMGHRPVTLLFATGAVQEVAIRLGQVFVLAGAPKPFAGLARGVYHVETALVLGWPAWCCALAWWAFQGPQKTKGEDHSSPRACRDNGVNRTPQPSHGEGGAAPGACQPLAVKAILATWLAFSVAMAIAFPLPVGWTSPVLHAWHVALAALSGLAIMLGFSRRREPAAVVASWLFAAQAPIALLGPFVRGRPWDADGDWYVARAGYIALFLLLSVRYALWLRPRRQENLR